MLRLMFFLMFPPKKGGKLNHKILYLPADVPLTEFWRLGLAVPKGALKTPC